MWPPFYSGPSLHTVLRTIVRYDISGTQRRKNRSNCQKSVTKKTHKYVPCCHASTISRQKKNSDLVQDHLVLEVIHMKDRKCMGASKSRNETKRKPHLFPKTMVIANLCNSARVAYIAKYPHLGSFVSSSIANQVRLYIAVYVLLLL